MMALQVQHFSITVPRGTLASTPQVSQMQLGVFQVDWVEVETPTGPNGEVGWYIAASGQQFLPFRVGNSPIWVVTSGTVKHWDATDWPTSGDWQLVAYNLGGFNHLLQVSWAVDLVGGTPSGVSSQVPVSSASLSSA